MGIGVLKKAKAGDLVPWTYSGGKPHMATSDMTQEPRWRSVEGRQVDGGERYICGSHGPREGNGKDLWSQYIEWNK